MSSFQVKTKHNNSNQSLLWLVMDLDHIFRRQYVGLQSYYSKIDSEKYHQGYQWENDTKFLTELTRQIHNRIKKLISIQHVNPNRVILASDDIKSETTDWIWRANIWSDWAQKFKNEFYNYRQGPVWNKIFSDDLLSFFKKEKYTYFKYIDFEADDIIAIITKSIIKKHPTDRVQIISQDSDFYQLIGPNIQVVNVLGEEEPSKFYPTGRQNLWLGIIGGRLSNNVPPLLFRVNKLKAFLGQDYDEEPEDLEPIGKYRRLTRREQKYCVENLDKFIIWLESTPELVENDQHLINKQIMDFNKIPTKCVNTIQHHFWDQYYPRNKIYQTDNKVKTTVVTKEEGDKKQNKNRFAALEIENSDDEN